MRGDIEASISLDAPLERVGAALEAALKAGKGWSLGAVDREGGTVEANLRAGWLPWSDQVRLVLESDEAGRTSLRGVLTPVPVGSRALRRARLGALLADLKTSLGEE